MAGGVGCLSQADIRGAGRIGFQIQQRGDYEPARLAVSDYFTALRAQTDNANDSAFSPAQRDGVMPLLVRRDELITLLRAYTRHSVLMEKWHVCALCNRGKENPTVG